MIGVFDSGIGGLSVFLELKKLSPEIQMIYFADSKNFPYGEKTQPELLDITIKATEKLLKFGVDTVIVACNSATVSTIASLRSMYPKINFIGVEPAIKMAVSASNHGNIGLLATKKTVNTHESDILAGGEAVLKHYDKRLIDMIENNFSDISEDDLVQAIEPLLSKGVKTIVLGCTHFYFVKNQLQKQFPDIHFIEPADIVARRALEIAGNQCLGNSIFLVSGDKQKFANFIENVVGCKNEYIRKI